MPLTRINKRTERLLIVKKKATGMSNPQLIELAIINLPHIIIKKRTRRNENE